MPEIPNLLLCAIASSKFEIKKTAADGLNRLKTKQLCEKQISNVEISVVFFFFFLNKHFDQYTFNYPSSS